MGNKVIVALLVQRLQSLVGHCLDRHLQNKGIVKGEPFAGSWEKPLTDLGIVGQDLLEEE